MEALYLHHSKKILTSFFFFLFVYAGAAQTNNTDEMILHIEHFSYEKQYSQLGQALYNYPAVHVSGYCKSLEVLMLTINRNKQPDDVKMFESLKNAGFVFVLKQDADIAKVQAACTDKRTNNSNIIFETK